MRNQSPVLLLLAAASVASLTACASSERTAADPGSYYGAGGADQAVDALGTANVAVYSNPAYRGEVRRSPSNEGFSGSSVPPGAPATVWSGTENWPPGTNGPEPPGSPSNGSDMGQFGD